MFNSTIIFRKKAKNIENDVKKLEKIESKTIYCRRALKTSPVLLQYENRNI